MSYGVYAEGRREGWRCSGYICKTDDLDEARAIYDDRVERDGAHELEWIRLVELQNNTEIITEVIDEWQRFVCDSDGVLGGQ